MVGKPFILFQLREPFSIVLIDCVGPLPKSKSGNEYLLTTLCTSTRFPEAIPLRNLKAKTTVKALIKLFTLVSLPKSFQSDQGSNFMSGAFQQVMYELGIHQYKSSAYHPESQGAIEQFHQTLKRMFKHIVTKQVKTRMKEFIFYCLLLETVFKNLFGSVLLNWFLYILSEVL